MRNKTESNGEFNPHLTDREYWEEARDKQFAPWQVNSSEFSPYLEGLLPENSTFTIAEFGAYPGAQLIYLAKRFGYIPTAIDFVEHYEHIEQMFQANGISNGKVIREDFFKLEPTQFDVSCSFGLIEHFENYEEVVDRHFQFTKPGGYVILSVPRIDGFQGLLYQTTYTQPEWEKVEKIHNPKIMNLHELTRVCKRNGAEILFADYIMGNSIYYNWDSHIVRDEWRWLVRYLNQAGNQNFPGTAFASPMVLVVAKKPTREFPIKDLKPLFDKYKVAAARSDNREAKLVLQEIITNDPDLIEPYILLSEIYNHENNLAEALTLLQAAPRALPAALEIYRRLAKLCFQIGEFQVARACLLEAICWAPFDPELKELLKKVS